MDQRHELQKWVYIFCVYIRLVYKWQTRRLYFSINISIFTIMSCKKIPASVINFLWLAIVWDVKFPLVILQIKFYIQRTHCLNFVNKILWPVRFWKINFFNFLLLVVSLAKIFKLHRKKIFWNQYFNFTNISNLIDYHYRTNLLLANRV